MSGFGEAGEVALCDEGRAGLRKAVPSYPESRIVCRNHPGASQTAITVRIVCAGSHSAVALGICPLLGVIEVGSLGLRLERRGTEMHVPLRRDQIP
jgi:hypothetical protein